MAESIVTPTFIYQEEHEMPVVDVSHLVTEDDTPVDNIFSERQMDLLVDSLYASWRGPAEDMPFVAMANVALYFALRQQPLVPDVLISLDVRLPGDVWKKENRSYLIWEYGKPPEVVVEIVSNRKGQEKGQKLAQYARLGIPYYVVYDPYRLLGDKPLTVYSLREGRYRESENMQLSGVGLGVTLAPGVYRGMQATWLRWQDAEGNMLLTGEEQAAQAQAQAAQAQAQAEAERERAERLAAQLRALGVEPEA
jgi:Uma2 family endonuclease